MAQRTTLQNKALHKFFELLADELNAAGLDQRKVLKPSIEIPWGRESIKRQLFKPIMNAMYPDKESTTQLTTDEVSKVYKVLNRHLAEKFSLTIPFPSSDFQSLILAYEQFETTSINHS
jgi:hypothetical protein